MEELLPLIIGILWLLYTFYTKGQKKKTTKPTPSEKNGSESKPSFLEQLFAAEGIQLEQQEADEIYEEEFEEVVVKQSDFAAAVREKNKTRPFLRSELSGFNKEGQSQFSSGYQYDITPPSEPDEIDVNFIREEGEFDLKKAVIFSTILNAPYIDYK